MSFFRIFFVAVVLTALSFGNLAPSAMAQDVPENESTITVQNNASTDRAIKTRISEIYAEIESLGAVSVEVTAGVVTLSGETMTADAGVLAETLASRVEGVVTVTNKIERDVSVATRVTPAFGALEAKLRSFLKGLPLLALAVVVFILIVLAGWFVSRLKWMWKALTPNRFVSDLMSSGVFAIFFILAVIAALSLLDATALLGTLLGAAGVFGLAIGFAVKDTIENYIASVMLSIRQPFRPNEHVVIDGNEGRVIRLTSRATVLMTLDGNHLRLPNAMVFKAVILNYTRNPERRFDFVVGIDPEQEGLQAIDIGTAEMEGLDFVLKEPPPNGVIQALGASTTDLQFTGWINQSETDFNKARSVAIARVKNALEASGFSLPDPSYRISVKGNMALPTFQVTETTEGEDMPPPVEPAADKSVQDVSPDTSLEQRVEEERREQPHSDLLSDEGKTE